MNILIAEDDDNSRQLLVDLFQSKGHGVSSFDNGLKALAYLHSHSVDLIVSDILMPEMDGYGLCRAVKQNISMQSIPFVFYTATYTSSQDERFAMSLGASAFLIKPMDLQAFLGVIAEVTKSGAKQPRVAKGRGLYRVAPVKFDKQHTDIVRAKLDKKIIELNQERQKLIESEARFRDFAEASADWFWEADSALNIQALSGAPMGLSVCNLQDIAKACQSHLADDMLSVLQQRLPFSDFIVHFIDAHEKHMYLRVSGKPIFDDQLKFIGYRGVGKDVSEMIALNRKVEFLASHDELTGLPNRSVFKINLAQALKKAERHRQQVLLLYFDIDHFKLVNDTLGHEAGDQLLMMSTKRIIECAREIDVLYRMGGDEFVMVIESATPQDAHRIVRDIVKAFSMPFEIMEQRVYTTVSIGVSVYPDDATDLQTLLTYADLAMYRAKQNGRNSFEFYTPNMNFIPKEWMDMEHGIRLALRKHEFHMVYQPQLDAERNVVVGMEALIRWTHPDHGLISTIELIRVAEQSSLINTLDDWVLEEVCRQMRVWREAGYVLPRMSVNMSARHLRSDNLMNLLNNIPKQYGIEPEMLCIEITEHAILEESATVKNNMQAIKKAGFGISLDDFGTGHSSLLYLKRWAVDEVKIERTFVNDLVSSDEDRAIVRAMVALAEALDLDLVGEGVENQHQADILLASGCRVIQGYFYSPPVPPDQVTQWFKKTD
ncbi:diguanylate cyclase (GGDEF) domain-containing protein [Methylophilaceae bacterium 11]|nr:diguanylate cyclase (GGDEF) domain-containing protein [Methylophilaceae bacterium 11]